MKIDQSEVRQLEVHVRDRQPKLALRELARLKQRHPGNPEIQFIACDIFRRLGMPEQGFRAVALTERPRSLVPVAGLVGRRILWAARFLNLMGASEFALDLVRFLDWSRPSKSGAEAFRIAGTLYLSHFDYPNAVRYFEEWRRLEPNPDAYPSRLNLINLGDALSGLRRYPEAIRLANAVALGAQARNEALLRGISLGAIGEYECRRGRFTQGLVHLEQAIACFRSDDFSPDRAFVEKWLGFARCKLGKVKQGTAGLELAFRSLRSAKLRPEAWLDVLRLQEDAVGIRDPVIQRSLREYPGLAPGFRALFKADEVELRRSECKLWIDLGANEYLWKSHRPSLGVPRELELLAYLRQAHPWGLPRIKAKSLLWPDAAHAFLQLEARLTQLIHRLRVTHGVRVDLDDGVLTLREPIGDLGVFSHRGQVPSFLREGPPVFSLEEMASYYRLSVSQSCDWLRRWRAQGWVEPTAPVSPGPGGKRGMRYRILCASL